MHSRWTLVMLPAALLIAVTQSACGNCDGALRRMRSQFSEWCPGGSCTMDNPSRLDESEPVPIPANDSFRIRADGPLADSAVLLERSGIGPTTWFLVDEATGQPVPASVTADSGGHLCMNGVGFNLKPDASLSPGDYTLVLLVARVHWPLVENGEERTYKGERAVARRYRVGKAD